MSDAEHFRPEEAIIRWSHVVVVQCDRLAVEGPMALRVLELHERGTIARHFDALHLAQADRHFLFVALHNLVRAFDACDYGRIPDGIGNQVKLVRDVLEHWDEYEAGSGPYWERRKAVPAPISRESPPRRDAVSQG